MLLPRLSTEFNLVLAQVFLLLSLRRIYSLQSLKNSEKKILDATLWIIIASIFYFWSILFLLALYFAILIKPANRMRYFLIPLVALTGSFIIAAAYFLVTGNSVDRFFNWMDHVSFDFSNYGFLSIVIAVTFIGALLVWTLIDMIRRIAKLQKKDRPNRVTSLVAILVSALIILVVPAKSGAELLFIVAPGAIVVASYVERESEFWFKELLLWLMLLLPVALLFVA